MPEKQKKSEKGTDHEVGFSALLAAVRKQLEEFEKDEDRLEFMDDLTDGYCRHCGTFDHNMGLSCCQCQNDE